MLWSRRRREDVVGDDVGGQICSTPRSIGQWCCPLPVYVLEVAGRRHLGHAGHASDRGCGALCGHQLEPLYFTKVEVPFRLLRPGFGNICLPAESVPPRADLEVTRLGPSGAIKRGFDGR